MNSHFRLTIIGAQALANDLAITSTLPLLQQLQCAGIKVPEACRNGNCGRCYARLIEGSATGLLDNNTLPLCVSYAHSNIQLELPRLPDWQLYACQLLQQSGDSLKLRLPAGRTTIQHRYFILFTKHWAGAVTLLQQQQRILELKLSHSAADHTLDQGLAQLLCVTPSTQGRYRLLNQQQVLLSGLSKSLLQEIHKSLLQSGFNTQICTLPVAQ